MPCVALPSECPLINLPSEGGWPSCLAAAPRPGETAAWAVTVAEGSVPKRLPTRAEETSRPAPPTHIMQSRTPISRARSSHVTGVFRRGRGAQEAVTEGGHQRRQYGTMPGSRPVHKHGLDALGETGLPSVRHLGMLDEALTAQKAQPTLS